ncbi:MAG TPA: Glu-tRNA(Gln) amidotransferase subunit GatE [Nitrososphaera sp.]|nr:Glu-tRNA(Gln) amidotransferase subunit GatE [Nitrososphaera sp.]
MGEFSIPVSIDPESIGLKVGFEIHQQLGTKSKLFCACSCEDAQKYDRSFIRKLRPTQSELGAYDPAAMFEFSKMRMVEYNAAFGSSCLVEADEEPPHDVNGEALEIALIISLALHAKVMDEIHVMRKLVIDGSNTTGFQRTMLVASGGYLEVAGKKIGVQSICLEEDAARLLGDENGVRRFALDRLGVPLLEVALEPVTGRPEDIMQVALSLGRLLRASKRVARGLGSIRQDVNISVRDGAVVEVKGVQQLDQLVKVIEHEIYRQHGLILIADKLNERKVDVSSVGDRIEDVTDILAKAQSKIVKKILDGGAVFIAIRVPGFAGMIGYEPYPEIRLGKELGKLVRFYDLDGVFHSDELPNYGITEQEVVAVRSRLQAGDNDAFVIVGGPKEKVGFASDAIIRRLQAAVSGVPAETRAATPDGKTVFLRPRPGAARMYPETDIPTIPVTDDMLKSLADKVPRSWDEIVGSLVNKYSLNKKLASQIFDSDYLAVFEEIAGATKIQPTFIASKLTEDITSLQRRGLDPSVLTEEMIKDVFFRVDTGKIAKESVIVIFEKLMKKEATTVDEAIKAAGVSSISDDELLEGLDKIINANIAVVNEKGMGALNTLMGRAMAEYRGRADGAKINSILKDKLQKLVK